MIRGSVEPVRRSAMVGSVGVEQHGKILHGWNDALLSCHFVQLNRFSQIRSDDGVPFIEHQAKVIGRKRFAQFGCVLEKAADARPRSCSMCSPFQ